MSDNSSAAVTPTTDPEGPSLLWVPYLSLTVILLLMLLASFVNYHLKNREKYENEKVKKEVRGKQQYIHKHRVTLNLRGALYDKRKPNKQSIDSNSTITTSVDSITELTPTGNDFGYDPGDPKEQLGSNVACYHNPAFRRSDQSLDSLPPDIFTVQDEKGKGKKIKNGGWRSASASAFAHRPPVSAGSSSEGRHLERRFTSPHFSGSQVHQESDRDSGLEGHAGRILSVTPAPTQQSHDAWGQEELIPMETISGDVKSDNDVTPENNDVTPGK